MAKKSEEHNPPHIHVQYAEYNAVVDFDGNVTDGDLPVRQRKLIEAFRTPRLNR